MNWINKIFSFLGELKLKHLFYVAGIVILILYLHQCKKMDELEAKNERYQNNIEVLNDSLRTTKDRLGNTVYKKRQLNTKVNELQNWNSDLKDKVDELKDKVQQATSIKSVIRYDTVRVQNRVKTYPNERYGLKWEYDTTFGEGNWKSIAGESYFRIDTSGKIIPKETDITRDKMGLELFTGVTKTDSGTREIFVRSKHPGFQVTELHGADLGPKKNQPSGNSESSFVIGPGIGVTVGKDFNPRPTAGIMVVWNLNKQAKKIFKKKGK